MSDIQEAFERLRALHFDCVPAKPNSKEPVGKWGEETFSSCDFEAGQNIAIHLGEAFVDVDLDSDEASSLGALLLPASNCRWGRKSRPLSHVIYRRMPAQSFKSESFSDDGKKTIVEVRTDKHLVIAPGSTHPCGETIDWVADGEPSKIIHDDLLKAVKLVALGTLILRHCWGPGSHHGPALGIAGVLCRAAGFTQDDAEALLKALDHVSPVQSLPTELAAIADTFHKHKSGQAVVGLSGLKDFGLPDAAASLAAKWLSLETIPASSAGAPNWAERLTTAGDFAKRPIAPKDWLLDGWFKAKDAILLYGREGQGKSTLTLALASALAGGTQFGGQVVPQSRRVLYMDGEMADADLQSLIKQLAVHENVSILAFADLQANSESVDITDLAQQDTLAALMVEQKFEVVIFDNLFSLATGIKEIVSNDDPGIKSVIAFCARLRNLGITSIIVHHSTKSGVEFAGATRLSVHLDMTAEISMRGDIVTVTPSKHRGRAKPPEMNLKYAVGPSGIALEPMAFGGMGKITKSHQEMILKALTHGPKSIREIAYDAGMSKTKVGEWLMELAAQKLVEKTNAGKKSPYHLTEQGKLSLVPAKAKLHENAKIDVPPHAPDDEGELHSML